MRDKREHGPGAPFRLCFPQLGRKAKWLPDRQEKAQRRVTEERGRPVCALDMEMTNYDLPGDSKLDCVNLGGLISRNGGDSSKVSVPVAQRTVPMEGDNLYRLRDRKFLLEDKKRLCALALGTAVLGIVLMIIHAETCPYINKPVGTKRIVSSRRRASFNVLDFPPKKLLLTRDACWRCLELLTDDFTTSSVHFYMHSGVIAIFLQLKKRNKAVLLSQSSLSYSSLR